MVKEMSDELEKAKYKCCGSEVFDGAHLVCPVQYEILLNRRFEKALREHGDRKLEYFEEFFIPALEHYEKLEQGIKIKGLPYGCVIPMATNVMRHYRAWKALKSDAGKE